MAQSMWESLLEKTQKAAVMQDGRRKVHYTFDDGKEMVEEYDSKTDELLLRKWRKKGTLGDSKPWDIEVGENRSPLALKDTGLVESSANPVVVRLDKLDCFQWRVRNLPYPIVTYDLKIEDNKIVIRTSNKKYFKRLEIPDLERLGIKLCSESLTFAHANNTLIISYNKPQQAIDFERRLVKRLKKLKSEGDMDQCKQQ